jgi:hypothetical protein
MQEQKGATTELEEAWGKAWSCSGSPPGIYIGSFCKGGRRYYFYKQGQEYFYETDFDREMRAEQRERRRNREQRMGKTNY